MHPRPRQKGSIRSCGVRCAAMQLNPAVREELLQEKALAIWESSPAAARFDRLLPFALRIAHNLGASQRAHGNARRHLFHLKTRCTM